jgi:signal peptide peptidase SppA
MSQPNKSYVLQAFVETPWAILPNKLAVLEEIVARHVSGEKLDADEIQSRIHGARRPQDRRVGSVAVLPLFGTIFPRANMMTDVSGATSAERFGAQFSELVNDPNIDAIVLDVDSPGGQVDGIEELSTQIFDARGQKPIVAVANHTMASAAYWIGTAADEIVVTPSGEVGSIGVFAVHRDISRALEQGGIKISLISQGKHKVEGNPYEPLAEEARAAIHERVSEYYDAFVNSIARNRGIEQENVRNGFGEGRVVGARQAVELGMADRVGTLEETIDHLFNRNIPSAAASSESLLTDDIEHEACLDTCLRKQGQAQSLRDYVQVYK